MESVWVSTSKWRRAPAAERQNILSKDSVAGSVGDFSSTASSLEFFIVG